MIPRSEWATRSPSKPLKKRPKGYNSDGWVWHWPGPYSRNYAGSGDYAGELESYRRYHQEVKGWRFLAYSFAVDPDGLLYEGRGWQAENAANIGANRSTYSLLFLGTGVRDDGTEHPPTIEAVEAAQDLMVEEPGDGTVRPHNAVSATGTRCPGTLLTEVIDHLNDQTEPEDTSTMYADLYAAYMTGGRPPSPAELKAWIADIRLNKWDVTDTCDYIAHTVASERR